MEIVIIEMLDITVLTVLVIATWAGGGREGARSFFLVFCELGL
jgi:hypothetical protein